LKKNAKGAMAEDTLIAVTVMEQAKYTPAMMILTPILLLKSVVFAKAAAQKGARSAGVREKCGKATRIILTAPHGRKSRCSPAQNSRYSKTAYTKAIGAKSASLLILHLDECLHIRQQSLWDCNGNSGILAA
jgi:hypothetical protein